MVISHHVLDALLDTHAQEQIVHQFNASQVLMHLRLMLIEPNVRHVRLDTTALHLLVSTGNPVQLANTHQDSHNSASHALWVSLVRQISSLYHVQPVRFLLKERPPAHHAL
jgi:hypothetical protein